MTGLTEWGERDVLDSWLLNGPVLMGLSTTDPASGVTPPSGGGYTDVDVAGSWAPAETTAGATTATNDTDIVFPAATDTWGTVGWYYLTDGTNIRWTAAIDNPTEIDTNDIATFSVGAVTVGAS